MAFSLKDYQITGEIGRGGFATVYRARQKSLPRDVAIKCLSPQRTQNEAEIIRFRREAEAMAALTHDNILTVYDYAYCGGSYYIVMEYIDGVSFEHALGQGCLPRQAALLVLEKVAAALVYAHAENIIHRDIKPANILLGRNGQVKVADFGLALFQSGIESYSAPAQVLGTLSYMAPEALVSPRSVDAAIDAFSMGCLLYQVCSGRLPFTGDSFGEVSHRLLNCEPAPLLAQEPLAPLIMRCLSKERDGRPAMTEIHDALAAVLSDGYHAARESLAECIRSSAPGKPSTSGPSPVVHAAPVLRPVTPLPTKKVPVLMAAAIVCLAGIAGVIAYYRWIPTRAPAPLPALERVQLTSALDEVAKKGAPMKETGGLSQVLSTDGPAPLTGPEEPVGKSVLEIRGLKPEDTVYINGVLRAHKKQYEIGPGRCSIEIRRKPGLSRVSRELDLLPYEREVVTLPQ